MTYEDVCNDVLLYELQQSHLRGELTPRLSKAIQHIATVVIDKKFPYYHDKEDMYSEAMVWFVRCWTHCNLEKTTNPLAFFSMGFYSCGLQVLSRERRECIVRQILPTIRTTEDEETT